MIKNKKVICLIPAKKKSQGLKNKNILPLKRRPLIYWTIKEAKKSKFIDDIMVSTDSKFIFNLSKKNGLVVPFLRPKSLSSFSSSIYDVIVHAKSYFDKIKNYQILILLQPTSPFRTVRHIDKALKEFVKNPKRDEKKLLSVCKINNKYNWSLKKINKNYLKYINKNINKKTNRQDADELFIPNGAIYIYNLKNLKKNFFLNKFKFFLMDKKSSIDIDTKYDFNLSKSYAKNLK